MGFIEKVFLSLSSLSFLCISFVICYGSENTYNTKLVESESDTLRVATYNIRIETSEDEGNRSWSNRKEYVANVIDSLYSFDVFGVQELATLGQQNDLMQYLSGYSIYSKGRYNNGNSGERVGIVYRHNRFTVLQKDFFYLSESPDVQSIGWDAALVRMCIWIKFYDNITNKQFYFFSTHFDHKGTEARVESAKLVLSKIEEITATDNNSPVILVGDFNFSTESGLSAYSILSGGILTDSRELVSRRQQRGPTGTSNGWDMSPLSYTEDKRIDFIFIDSLIYPLSYLTIDNKFVSDAYPSDHFPVLIKCLFNKEQTPDDSDTDTISAISDGMAIKSQPYVYIMDNQIHIVCREMFTYAIYDNLGRQVCSESHPVLGEVTHTLTNVRSSLCFIRLVTKNDIILLKIFIR